MKVKSFILFFAFLLNVIAAFAQYTLHVGEKIYLEAPPSTNSSYPNFMDATWKVVQGTQCVSLSPNTGQQVMAHANAPGTATISCSARYATNSGPMGVSHTYVNKQYTITCLTKENPGGGGNGGDNGGGSSGGDNGDVIYKVNTVEGVQITLVKETGVTINGRHFLSAWGYRDKVPCVSSNTVGTVTIPSSHDGCDVRIIAGDAFYKCSDIEKVIIPNTVTTIANTSFWYCGVKEIDFGNSVTTIESSSFRCDNLKTLVLPSSLKRIGRSAFECPNLEEVTLPENLEKIEGYAFSDCDNLKKVTCLSQTPLSLSEDPFWTNIYDNAILYVPKGSKTKYQNASYWKNFKTIKEIGESDDVLVYDIRLNETSVSLTVGSTKQLTATISPSNATDKSVTWKSSNTTIATVSTTGLVTAVSEGSATITCTANDGSGVKATCSITVKKKEDQKVLVSKITLTESSASLTVGSTMRLKATISPSDATDKSVTWKTSNTTVATVSTQGLVTAVSEGSATITCTANDGSGVKATCSISVTKKSYPVKDSGVEGNITWVLTTDGTLTLSGKGEMENVSKHAWDKYKYDIKEAIIENGITTIGDFAFEFCTLTSVTIPNSVTIIERWAFSSCRYLTSVTIPNSVTSIEDYAFDWCSSLASATIGNSVKSIGSNAFWACSKLTSVNIPASVISIKDKAFEGCTALKDLRIAEGNPSYMIENGTIFSKDKKTLVFYLSSNKDKSYTIPSNVTTLGHYAFSGNPYLSTVIIPNSVLTIGRSAFMDCTSLTSVTFPKFVKAITHGLFWGCTALTSMVIPNSISSIESNAFRDCTGLTSVTIPNSVTSIEKEAFRGCKSLNIVYCYAVTPPTLGYDKWSGAFSNPETITLYVPQGSLEAYKTADQWKDFFSILEMDDEMQGIVSNISIPESSTEIYDIQGRRLNKISGQGLYVQNGKKRIVK